MEPQDRINGLVHLLREVYAEEELHNTLAKELKALRELYRHTREAFSPEHIAFLKTVAQMDKAVETFIGLKEELEDVYDLEDSTRLMARLEDVRNALRGSAVVRRVEKEIRGLREKLPDLARQNTLVEGSKISAKILQLERQAPNCTRGHHMVIRQGESEYFWGCGEFPRCFLHKKLAQKEAEFLTS